MQKKKFQSHVHYLYTPYIKSLNMAPGYHISPPSPLMKHGGCGQCSRIELSKVRKRQWEELCISLFRFCMNGYASLAGWGWSKNFILLFHPYFEQREGEWGPQDLFPLLSSRWGITWGACVGDTFYFIPFFSCTLYFYRSRDVSKRGGVWIFIFSFSFLE